MPHCRLTWVPVAVASGHYPILQGGSLKRFLFLMLVAILFVMVSCASESPPTSAPASATIEAPPPTAVNTAVPNPVATVEKLSNSLANDAGRAFMLSQPCVDVLAEYNAMKIAGHDAAAMHVSNVYNIKTGTDPYIAISDALARIEECS